MQYDMAYKRAQRLQNRSWAEIQVEAHKLAMAGLPVDINVSQIRINYSSLLITPTEIFVWRNSQFEHGTIIDVAQALRDLLAQRREQAAKLAGVAGALKQATEGVQS